MIMKKLFILLAASTLLGGVVVAADSERVRSSAVAGSWYPGDPGKLAAYLDELLQGNVTEVKPQVRALIAPHAGYMYSGSTAADAYRQLRGRAFDRVLVLGPAHHGWFHGLSVADVEGYETPLGRIPLDLPAVERLRGSDLVSADPQAHRREHSIEMQLPMLQRVLKPGWKLLPVLVGNLQPGEHTKVADLLRPMLEGNTLVVASSDFTHYGSRFDYLPFPNNGKTAENLEKLDRGALQFILDQDPEGFLDYQRRTGITICGYHPIAVLLYLMGDEAVAGLETYATSGELTGDYRSSVSYLSISFRDKGEVSARSRPGDGFAESNMQLLHAIASVAVESAAKPRDNEPMRRLQNLLDQVPPELEVPSGAFVTLKRDGRLRGCIGYIQPVKPLFEAVAANGINAARNDHRFMPLREEELPGLEVEVSVLTPPRPVDSYEDFRVGEEGIILEKDGRSAVFLPEVAVEQGWDRDETLTQLARKAGLPGDAWKQGASFKTFRSQKYSAPYARQ